MIDYELIRSKRKTLVLRVSKELKIIVKAPLRMPKRDIETFIFNHEPWIEKQLAIMQERRTQAEHNALSDNDIKKLKQKAKVELPPRVSQFAKLMNVVPTGMKITSAHTRWGSCSGKNSLCFSYLLMLLPDDLIDYIVVHELAHIKEKNHSARFYAVVEKYLPDYKDRIKKLKKIQHMLPI